MSIRLPAGLRTQLLLLVAVTLLPAVGLVVYDTFRVRRETVQEKEKDAARLAHLAAGHQDKLIEDAGAFLARFARRAQLGGERSACDAFLLAALNDHPEYANIGVLERDGRVACSALPVPPAARLETPEQRTVMERVMQGRRFAVGDYAMGDYSAGAGSKTPVLLLAVPVDRDARQRVVVASLDLSWMSHMATNAQLAGGAMMSIVDRNGRLVARYPEPEKWLGRSVRESDVHAEVTRQRGRGTAEGTESDGISRLYAFTPLGAWTAQGGQYLSVGIPVATLRAKSNLALQRNLLLLLVVCAASVAVAWLFTDAAILRPVQRVLDATTRVARGDLSARCSVRSGGGEIDTLAAAFDEMAESLEGWRSQREHAEKLLRDERDYVSHIISLTPALVCGIAPDGTTMFVNPAVETTTGYRALDLIGRNWWTTFYPGERSVIVDQLFRDLESGPVRDYEMDLTTSSGATRTVSWNSLNKLDEHGNVVEVIGFGMDINERKTAERERDSLEVELRRSQKVEAMGQLAAGIAHEINTPTQYIGDNMRFLGESFSSLEQLIQMLRELINAHRLGPIPEGLMADAAETVQGADLEFLLVEIPRAITQSLEGVERVARLVRAMKEFSHPGSEEKLPVDLNHALESTVTVATSEWKYVANLVLDLDEQLPPVPVRSAELNQVFLNLIVNAGQAIADAVERDRTGKGVITLTTRRLDDWAEIRIADTGNGIPPEIRERVFDPFFTTKAVGKGTGQGLAICHSVIVDRHGGTVAFETELGVGTTFIVRLPLAPDGARAEVDGMVEMVG